MTDRGWKSKGEKVPRRSPRKTGKTCGRPFKAPRKKGKTKVVAEVEDSDVQLVEQDKEGENESQVQCIAESQNKRDMEGKEEAEPIRINPYPNGIRGQDKRENKRHICGIRHDSEHTRVFEVPRDHYDKNSRISCNRPNWFTRHTVETKAKRKR